MSDGAVLRAEGVSKKFAVGMRKALYYGVADIGAELTWWRRREPVLRNGEFWAVKDVSLELHPGQSIGVIGANGAGKSTLLKLLTGLLKPDAGTVMVRGRLRAMIELGAAFSPDLSGRENIYAQASLYGYQRRELTRQIDAIIDFAGIGRFIDAPVQQYSDGMRARLGFAIAVHLQPDILLVDEVLAVGDIAFQNKCMNFMRQYLAQGGAVVFVGHGSHQVQAICDWGIVLAKGEKQFAGPVVDALDYYFRLQQQNVAAAGLAGALDGVVDGTPAKVSIDRLDIEPVETATLQSGSTIRITMHYTSNETIDHVGLGFSVYAAESGVCIGGGYPQPAVSLREGTHSVACLLPRTPILAGEYLLKAYLFDELSKYPLAATGWDDRMHRFVVESDPTPVRNLSRLAGVHISLESAWDEGGNAR